MATVTGKVKYFNPQKGYGFVELDNGESIYVHVSSITEGHIRNMLFKDETVTFEVAEGRRGKEAVDVVVDKPDRNVRFVSVEELNNVVENSSADESADVNSDEVDEETSNEETESAE